MTPGDIVTTQVPLWGVFTHLVCLVGGWYAHMKYGQRAQALVDMAKDKVNKL